MKNKIKTNQPTKEKQEKKLTKQICERKKNYKRK